MIPIVLKVYDCGKLKSSRAFRTERIRLGSAAADLVLDSASVAPSVRLAMSRVSGSRNERLGGLRQIISSAWINPTPAFINEPS